MRGVYRVMLKRLSLLLPCALAAAGCTGSVPSGEGYPEANPNESGVADTDGATAESTGSGGSTGSTSGGSSSSSGPVTVDDISGVDDPLTLPDGVPATTQLPRLTHSQYQRAVSDLLLLDVDVIDEFPSEQPTLNGYYDATLLRVTDRLYADYQRVADELAPRVIATPESYAQVVGCTPTAAGCRDEFLQGFLLRAYRRPATSAELERYRELFDRAAELVQSGDGFADGVQMVVQAVLQSPNFLYRVERGTADPASPVELTAFEKAARLSFMLTDTLPDATLLSEASAGRLSSPEQVAAQAERLMQSDAFADKVRDFHSRWLNLDGLLGVSKDSAKFPEFSGELAGQMREETLHFVEEATLRQGGAVTSLLTAPYTFVDQGLAGIYGLSGDFGSEFVRVDLDPNGRRLGLLTQPSFLTGHSSSSTGTSPILRAVYLLKRVLCQDVPDPPPGALTTEPPAPAQEPVTTREYFEWKTSMPVCRGCHDNFNPMGFAFEEFDAIGRHRDVENGAPVDTSGSFILGQATYEFSGARELIEQLAQSREIRACYAKQWLDYSYAREDTTEDLRTLALVQQALEDPSYSVRNLLTQLTQSAAFSSLLRAAE